MYNGGRGSQVVELAIPLDEALDAVVDGDVGLVADVGGERAQVRPRLHHVTRQGASMEKGSVPRWPAIGDDSCHEIKMIP